MKARRPSPLVLGCVGVLAVASMLCSVGWYFAFVRYQRLGWHANARLPDGEAVMYRRRHLPGMNAFLVERSRSSGERVWTRTLGGFRDGAALRALDGALVVTLRHHDGSSEHLGLAIDDGAMLFQVPALGAHSRVLGDGDGMFEALHGVVRRVSLVDGREEWRASGDPGRMPDWPLVRGGEVIAFGLVLDAATGDRLPPGRLPESWCQEPSLVAWDTSDGIARRRRGSSDVVTTGLDGRLRDCQETPLGVLVVRERGDERRLVLLDDHLAPRWDVPTSGEGAPCATLVDGAVAQRVLDDFHAERVLRFDPVDGRLLGESPTLCDETP